jgi:hypothetical protein
LVWKYELYSHFEEKSRLMWTTEDLIIVRDLEVIEVRRTVKTHWGESNPHEVALTRLWVWHFYQFHHLGIINTFISKPQTHDWASAPTDSSTGKPGSTIGARGLNFCVRDGNRCDSPARSTGTQAWVCNFQIWRFCLSYINNIWEGLFGFYLVLSQVARPISTGKLHMLPCFHLRPIKQVIFLWPLGT